MSNHAAPPSPPDDARTPASAAARRVLLATPLTRGPGYAIAASLSRRGHAVHVTTDLALPTIHRSRFYASVDHVSPPRGTLTGGIAPRPATPQEERYRDELLDICARRRIEAIMPGTEVDLVFLSRNLAAFRAQGVLAIAPEFERLAQVSDKFALVETARRHGFPVADALLCASPEEVEAAGERLGRYPLIVRGRSGMGSSFSWRADDASQLRAHWETARGRGLSSVFVQHFVQGGRERSFNYLLAPDGTLLCAFALAKPHHALPSQSTSVVVMAPPPELETGARMLRALGITGFAAIQTILDPEDGRHKIIEVNARLGSNARILHGMGIDIAGWLLDSAFGLPVPVQAVPPGRAGVSLLESVVALSSFRAARRHSRETTPTPLGLARSYLRLLARRPSLDVHSRHALRDPWGYWCYAREMGAQVFKVRSEHMLTSMIPWGDLNFDEPSR